MVTFLRILVGVALLVAVLIGFSYVLPRHITVERDVVIDAPAEVVFEQVNSLQTFAEWSPWSDYDPDMEVVFSGPTEGVGNRMEWSSMDPQVGRGSQEIVESTENRSVRTALDFGEMGSGEAWFVLEPSGTSTNVTWGLEADMGNTPTGRYMGLVMDQLVGGDYERGLAALKLRAEAANAQPGTQESSSKAEN
ncbi:SRPBCC family protein [Amaricoccus macauensis]|uniref:SRPBCC family protein n=1 Tax=Amaricoccus macauensis TaxID=57001 RepID=UPI003C7DAD67